MAIQYVSATIVGWIEKGVAQNFSENFMAYMDGHYISYINYILYKNYVINIIKMFMIF